AMDSGMSLAAEVEGTVERVTGENIEIRGKDGKIVIHQMIKYLRSNQDTCLNHRPIVRPGDKVEIGQVIADGAATQLGELALGRNIMVAFMPWEGYNFEDAIL